MTNGLSTPPGARATTPGVRAVAGGMLVACAALGVLVAPSGAVEPEERFLVLTAPVAAGDVIDGASVESLPMQLPPAVAAAAIQNLGDDGVAVARAAMPAGSLLHGDQLRRTPAPTGVGAGAEVTVALPKGRALGGDVHVGETVDLAATYGNGADGFTSVVGTEAVLTQVTPTDAALGLEPALTLGLRLSVDTDPLAVVHAVRADALSLIRPSPRGSNTSAVYLPSPPESAAP